MRRLVYEIAAAWLACGLDPERVTFYRQSDIPEVFELTWILQCFTSKGWMNKAHAYKALIADREGDDVDAGINMGVYSYPVLMAADIIAFDIDHVPVGKDQVQHVEIARDIAQRINSAYGKELLRLPAAKLAEHAAVLPGVDGRKMSKSYGNAIDLSDTPETVVKKVRQMYTDPKRVRADIPGTVEGNPVFTYHDVFNANRPEVDDLKARYRAGQVGDVEVKTKLAAAINATLAPMRERRAAALARPGDLRELVVDGSRRARAIAQATMARVRDAVHLKY
jgi:tryptophanyl-tRNA synthetase